MLFSIPLGTGKYPLIGLDDIAWFTGFMFENWRSWGSRDLAVVGDSPTGEQIAASFERVTGVPSGYTSVPLDFLRSSDPAFGHDFAGMMQFFQQRDIASRDRDMQLLREIHPNLMSFEDWLHRTRWDGTEADVRRLPIRAVQEYS